MDSRWGPVSETVLAARTLHPVCPTRSLGALFAPPQPRPNVREIACLPTHQPYLPHTNPQPSLPPVSHPNPQLSLSKPSSLSVQTLDSICPNPPPSLSKPSTVFVHTLNSLCRTPTLNTDSSPTGARDVPGGVHVDQVGDVRHLGCLWRVRHQPVSLPHGASPPLPKELSLSLTHLAPLSLSLFLSPLTLTHSLLSLSLSEG